MGSGHKSRALAARANAKGARGRLRYIDYSSADERATIGDPHHCGAPVFLIIDVNQCPKRQRPMRSGKILWNAIFSARRFLAHG